MSNPYYTHRPFLKQELDSLVLTPNKKFILELGVGDGSSELFNNYAKLYSNLEILGIDTDHSWVQSMEKQYSLPNYTILFTEFWEQELYKKLKIKYDLVFIDQSPWMARIEALDYFTDNFTKTIILHDYDYFNLCSNKYSVDHQSFFAKYRENYIINGYFQNLPPTLILRFKNANI